MAQKESNSVLRMSGARLAFGDAGRELFYFVQQLVEYLVTNFPENAVLPLLNSVLAKARDLDNPIMDVGTSRFNWVELEMFHFSKHVLGQRKARQTVWLLDPNKLYLPVHTERIRSPHRGAKWRSGSPP